MEYAKGVLSESLGLVMEELSFKGAEILLYNCSTNNGKL